MLESSCVAHLCVGILLLACFVGLPEVLKHRLEHVPYYHDDNSVRIDYRNRPGQALEIKGSVPDVKMSEVSGDISAPSASGDLSKPSVSPGKYFDPILVTPGCLFTVATVLRATCGKCILYRRRVLPA